MRDTEILVLRVGSGFGHLSALVYDKHGHGTDCNEAIVRSTLVEADVMLGLCCQPSL